MTARECSIEVYNLLKVACRYGISLLVFNSKSHSFAALLPYYYKIVQVKSNYGVEVNIVNVTEDDFGLYTCLVSNHIGNDFTSAFLIKNVKPTVPVTGQYLFKTRRSKFSPIRS